MVRNSKEASRKNIERSKEQIQLAHGETGTTTRPKEVTRVFLPAVDTALGAGDKEKP